MNFQNLEYFLTVAEEASITRAAERLHLSQQALSGHIIRLEEEIGLALFDRKPTLQLTYAGERFLTQAREMINMKRQSEAMIRDIRENEKGKLAIGISYSRGQALLPILLPEYSAAHPLVDLSIVEDRPDALEARLNQGTLDVMIGFLPFSSQTLDAKPLFQEHLFLVASKDLLKTRFGDDADRVFRKLAETSDLSLISDLPFVFLRKGEHIRTMIDREFEAQKVVPNVRIETSNTQTALALAAEGMGVTIVHEVLLKSSYTLGGLSNPATRERVVITPLKKATLADTVGIGFHKDRYMPKITRDFIALCEQKLTHFGFEEI